MQNYIFVSYAHKDAESVAPIINNLKARGYRVWYDADISAAKEWDKEIADHLEGCSFFMTFMSQAYLDSSNCKDELNFARDLNKKRLLVYIDDVTLPSEMRMRLSRVQDIYYYSYEKEEDFYKKLFQADGIQLCKGEVADVDMAATFECAGDYVTGGRVSKRFENVSVENKFTERVNSDSFNDRQSRNKLFSLYADLVAPVRKVEELSGKMKELQKNVEFFRDENNVDYGFGPYIAVGVFIVAFIMSFFDNNIVASLLDAISPVMVTPVTDWLENTLPLILAIPAMLIYLLLTMVFVAFLCALVFIIVWLIYFILIKQKIGYRSNLKLADKLQAELDELSAERDQLRQEMQEKLKYVPNEYRHSEALNYLSTVYRTSRADTLKEAVNLYEQEMEGAGELVPEVIESMEYLKGVSEQLEV